jgi:hypothetical protein
MTSPPRYDGLADRYDREIGGLEVTTTAIDALGAETGHWVFCTNGSGTAALGVPTLDGLGWLRDTAPGDPPAIDWLRENTPGTAVVLEAVGEAIRAVDGPSPRQV